MISEMQSHRKDVEMEIPALYMMERLPLGLGAGFFILFHDMWERARLDVLMSSHLGENGQWVFCELAATPVMGHWSLGAKKVMWGGGPGSSLVDQLSLHLRGIGC